MKVLVVDDSHTMRHMIARSLVVSGPAGLQVTEAADGRAAYMMILEDPPDLVVCDWNMPEMSGIELLRQLRDESNPIHFGFMTSECTDRMRDEAIESGAAFFLTKPFTAEELWAEVSALDAAE